MEISKKDWTLTLFLVVLAIQGILLLTSAPTFSYLMDDWEYHETFASVSGLLVSLSSEIIRFFELGRFTPVKVLYDGIKWTFLPWNPYAFVVVNLAVVFLVASVLARLFPDDRHKSSDKPVQQRPFLVFLILLLSQLPFLQITRLNSVGEGLLCIWILLGFSFLKRKQLIKSGCFFVLAALTKEPGTMGFFAASYFLWKQRQTKHAVSFLLSGLCLVVLFWWIKSRGTYLAHYGKSTEVFLENARLMALRLGLGFFPFCGFIFLSQSLSQARKTTPLESALLFFSALYGACLIPLSVAHYLLPPVVIGPLYWVGARVIRGRYFRGMAILYLLSLTFVTVRFVQFCRAQAEVSVFVPALREKISSTNDDLWILNAPELVIYLKKALPSYQTKIVYSGNPDSLGESFVSTRRHKTIHVIEFIYHFGPIDKATLLPGKWNPEKTVFESEKPGIWRWTGYVIK